MEHDTGLSSKAVCDPSLYQCEHIINRLVVIVGDGNEFLDQRSPQRLCYTRVIMHTQEYALDLMFQ